MTIPFFKALRSLRGFQDSVYPARPGDYKEISNGTNFNIGAIANARGRQDANSLISLSIILPRHTAERQANTA
jgi:hypothetical protein